MSKYDMTSIAQAIEPLGNIMPHRGDGYHCSLRSEQYEIDAQIRKLQKSKRLIRVAIEMNKLRNDGYDVIDLAECVRDRRGVERLCANDSSS